jgi:exodeoxyribonuclease VII small subunit
MIPGEPSVTEPTSASPGAPTYEAARAELEDVVRRLEAGGVTLEESLALWERGEALARACQDFLDGARARIAAAHRPEPS